MPMMVDALTTNPIGFRTLSALFYISLHLYREEMKSDVEVTMRKYNLN